MNNTEIIKELILKALSSNTYTLKDFYNFDFDINSIPRISISEKAECNAVNEFAYRNQHMNILMIGMSRMDFHHEYNQRNCYLLDSRNNLCGQRFDYIIFNNITHHIRNMQRFNKDMEALMPRLRTNCKILAIG